MFRGLTDAAKTGVMFGFDDEIKGGMAALPAAAINFAKGDGFNLGEQYNKFQQQFDAEKQARREAMPIASTFLPTCRSSSRIAVSNSVPSWIFSILAVGAPIYPTTTTVASSAKAWGEIIVWGPSSRMVARK